MDKLKGFVSKKGEKQKSSGADVAAIENAELKSDDRRLANLAAAFRKKAGELGLSGSVGVSVVLGFADVVELELGWGLEMTQYEEESAVVPAGDPDEKVAFDCVNTYCSVANDIKRRSLKWKIPMSVTVGLQVGVVKVEATLNVAPSAEARERDMEAILAADWGEVDIRPGNEFVILKSELVHHEGEPYNRAISKTLIGKKFDGLRDKIISSCKSMEAAGYKGSIKANLTISFPTLLTMGVKCFDLSIGIEVGMTELLAAKRLWEEDEKVRNAGQLTVKVGEGCNLPVMDFTSSDPFVVCAIEGGRKEDARQSKTISSELNPKWNETLAPMPCAQTGETLIVSLYDEDNLHSHDFIDEWVIPLDKIKLVPGQPKMLICPLKVRDEYRKETKKLDHNIGIWLTWSPAH